MFFFYSIHNKNYAKTPTIDAQAHLLVIFQPLPIRLGPLIAMNVLHNHHLVIIFENQRIIVDKCLEVFIQFIVWFFKYIFI